MKRKLLKIPPICFALLLFCKTTIAQTTFNTCGNHANSKTMQHDYSIGEMTLVHTASNQHLIITQGLLQPEETNLNSSSKSKLDISLYPNPTSDIVYLDFLCTHATTISYSFFDINGKLITTKQEDNLLGSQKILISLSDISLGNYILKAKISTEETTQQFNFKITKQ